MGAASVPPARRAPSEGRSRFLKPERRRRPRTALPRSTGTGAVHPNAVITDTRTVALPAAERPATPDPHGEEGPPALRANKLDLLERLADDLAHEIKNPLHSMVINL